jgi:hypothetical protein
MILIAGKELTLELKNFKNNIEDKFKTLSFFLNLQFNIIYIIRQ